MDQRLERLQLLLIVLPAIAVGIVVLKVIFKTPPTAAGLTTEVLQNPKQILDQKGWQLTRQDPLQADDLREIVEGDFWQGEQYVLQNKAQTLIVSQALISYSDGDLKTFIKKYQPDLASTLHSDAQIGQYSQFFQGDRLTMVACLTAQNRATVTADQFKVEQIRSTFSVRQISGWLRNRHSLVPQTCRWRSLSIAPANADSPQTLLHLWQKISL